VIAEQECINTVVLSILCTFTYSLHKDMADQDDGVSVVDVPAGSGDDGSHTEQKEGSCQTTDQCMLQRYPTISICATSFLGTADNHSFRQTSSAVNTSMRLSTADLRLRTHTLDTLPALRQTAMQGGWLVTELTLRINTSQISSAQPGRISGLPDLRSLRMLTSNRCTIPEIQTCANLATLEVTGSGTWMHVPASSTQNESRGWSSIFSPETHELTECSFASYLGTALRTLIIHDAGTIPDVSGLQQCSGLTVLKLESLSTDVTGLSVLRSCTELTTLCLTEAYRALALPPLVTCTLLQTLDLSCSADYKHTLTDITYLEACTTLTDLNLHGWASLVDISILKTCTGLIKLDLSKCSSLVDIFAGAAGPPPNSLVVSSQSVGYTSLTNLNLSGCTSLADITMLRTCTELIRLDLSGCVSLVDISALTACPHLTDLSIGDCGPLLDPSPLADCLGLVKLVATNVGWKNLSPLWNHSMLRWLRIENCRFLDDLSSLATCPNLVFVYARGCTQLRDVSALLRCRQLRMLDVREGTFMEQPGLAHVQLVKWWPADRNRMYDWMVAHPQACLQFNNGDTSSEWHDITVRIQQQVQSQMEEFFGLYQDSLELTNEPHTVKLRQIPLPFGSSWWVDGLDLGTFQDAQSLA
jgi:hypothetical protein